MIPLKMKDKFVCGVCVHLYKYCNQCPFNIDDIKSGTCGEELPDREFMAVSNTVPFFMIEDEKARLKIARWISIMSMLVEVSGLSTEKL